MPPVIDLRSDTVTRPTAGMLEAMAAAETGDDVYGEDPTVTRLEQRVAAMFGHQAGLFTVTGSLANVLGVAMHVAPGQELLCESRAHVVRAELGAHAVSSGVTTRTWTHPRGAVDLPAIAAMAAPDAGPYLVSTAAVAVENTHNFGGGTVQELTALRSLRDFADDAGLALHLDGARWWNAHVATGASAADTGAVFDSVSVCLSKGLGAPVGSVLVGSADAVARARVQRKRAGGGWRQAGVLAAAGLYALDHHVQRLAEDHAHARLVADAVVAAAPDAVDPTQVVTNIVLIETGDRAGGAAAVVEAAAEHGVRVSTVGPRTVRVITHLDVSAAQAERAAEVLADTLRR